MIARSKTCIIEGIGPILLERSKRARKINITLKPFKGVRVAVPLRVSYHSAEQFARSQSDWIKKQLLNLKQKEARYKKLTENLREFDSEDARKTLVKRLADLAAKHRFTYNRVFIRNQKTRWGSCSAKNNISLNIKLARLPEEVSDYVILHELVHTRIKNHGKRFWQELDKIVDNAKALRSQLLAYSYSGLNRQPESGVFQALPMGSISSRLSRALYSAAADRSVSFLKSSIIKVILEINKLRRR
jgi:predicted metal-dependent hydrolase